MLSAELQPAVRQIVERNEQLETENKQLYDKVHELMTETTALKAAQEKFRQHCESMVVNQAHQLISPSKDMQERMQRQRHQIERLQSKLAATQSEAKAVEQEREELEERLECQAESLEKTTQKDSRAVESCQAMTRTMSSLIAMCRANGGEEDEDEDDASDTPQDVAGAVNFLQRRFRVLGEECAAVVQQRQRIAVENTALKQTISELETRLRVLETEKSATDECNMRYEKEREELSKAIATLRSALDCVKTSLIEAEAEKKTLKEENVRLRIELSVHGNQQLIDDDDDLTE